MYLKAFEKGCLREDKITLDDLLSKARTLEASKLQATGIEQSLSSPTTSSAQSDLVNRVSTQFKPGHSTRSRQQKQKCNHCGYSWPHRTSPCPAQGKSCNQCGKANHFAKVCRTHPMSSQPHPSKSTTQEKQKQQPLCKLDVAPSEDSSTDDEYLYTVKDTKDAPMVSTPIVSVKVDNVPIKRMVDSGATTDIIDETTF